MEEVVLEVAVLLVVDRHTAHRLVIFLVIFKELTVEMAV